MSDVLISLDQFPCRVALPGSRTVEPVRCIIADDVLHVFMGGNGGIQEIYTGTVHSTEGAFNSGALMALTDDGPILIGKAAGCGCGSALKQMEFSPGDRKVHVFA